MEQQKRSFTIVEIVSDDKNVNKNLGGRYMSRTAVGAAKKAMNHVLRNNKSKYFKATIHLKETTRNSKNKVYKYNLTRIYKKDPITIEVDNNKITYKYDIFTKFVKKPSGYICSNEEKNDKKLGVCCSKGNSLNERTYESCKKHILRMKKE